MRRLNEIHFTSLRNCPLKYYSGGKMIWNAWLRKYNSQAREWYFNRFDIGEGVDHYTYRVGAGVVHLFILPNGEEIWTAKRGQRWMILSEEEIRRAEDALLAEGALEELAQ